MALAQDLSVTAITAPTSGCALSAAENVTIRIFNYGSSLPAGTTFNVSYTINAGAPVTEMVTLGSTLLMNSTLNYTFTTQANLSTPGSYTFTGTVSIAGDVNPTNDTFSGYSVTNTGPSVGGTVTGGTNVCISGNSGILTLTGNTGNVVRWEYSTDGGSTWVNISNTTGTQSYTNLTVPTRYRALVQNGTCTSAYSSVAIMTIDPASVGGTLSGTTTVCSGSNTGTMNLSGKTGTVVRWEFSIDAGATWNPITNTATSQTYTNLTQTTRYRVIVQSGSCSSTNSTAAIITVSPVSVGGTVSGGTTVCSGSNSGSLTLAGHTGTVSRWESSTDGGVTWANIANTTTSQTYTNLTTTTWYHALVKSGSCSAIYSSTDSIVVTAATVAGSIAPASTTVCSGTNSGTLTLSGYTGTIQYWEFSTDGGATWTNIANTTNTQNYTNLTVTRIYRANVRNGSCTASNSVTATVTVNPVSVGGIVTPTSMTVCSGSNSGTVTLSGQTGTVTSWESSPNGITWTPIANTTTSQSFSNLTATTYYHAIVKSGVCSSATSSKDTIKVDVPSVGGTVSASSHVCYGTNSGTLTLSGQTGNVIRWEYSIDGGINWNPISNTTTTYSYANITLTTTYRAIVQNGVCSVAPSGTAVLTVDPVSVGGTINGSTTACGGSNSGTLDLISYVGTIQRWESSTDGGATWTPIANTTATQNYTNVSTTTLYHAIVMSGVCSSDTSAVATISVDPPTVGGTLSMDDTVCSGSNTGTLTLTGETGTIQHWESSTDNGTTWITIANTTNTQTFNNLTATTMYRAFVKSGVCNGLTSNAVTITVDPKAIGGTVNSSTTICDTVNSGILTLTGSTGAIQGWQSSTDGGATWNAIANTTTTQTYTNITVTTWYRAIVASGVCGTDTSSVAKLTLNPTIPGTLSMSDTVCASSNFGTLTLSGQAGTVQHWETSTDNGITWNVISNTSTSQTYVNLTATTSYRVYVQNGTCPGAVSNTVTITVNPLPVGGMISGGTTVCDTINSGTLTLTGYTGTIQNWESSTNSGATWTSIANTTATQTYTNLTDTTWFRAIVTSGICGMDTSTYAVITVNPKTVGGTLASSDTVCVGSNNGVLHLSGYTGAVQNWQFSTDGGFNWFTVTNTTDSLTYNNLSVTTIYRVNVKSGICNTDTSNRVTITVNPYAVAGTITGGTSVCDTINSGTLTLTSYTGTIQNWESSTDGGLTWTSISNTTATQSYTNLTDTTWFRAIVSTGVCGTDTSTVATIYVNPRTVGGMIASSDTVCAGSNSGVLHLTGYVGTVQSWEYSTDGGSNWIPSANTTDSVSYTNLTMTTMYRANVKSGVCNSDTSMRAVITVNPVSVGGSISGAAPGCSGANGGTLTLSGYAGNITGWQSSIDGGATWTAVANTTTTQTYLNLVDTTWYRAIVQSGVCSADTSAVTAVIVYPKPVAAGTASTVCFGSVTAFTNSSTISSGFIQFNQWDFGDGNNSLSINPTHTYGAAGTFNATLLTTSNLGCLDTASITVTVNAVPDNTITASGALQFCFGDSVTLSAAGGPYNYMWSTAATTQSIIVTAVGTHNEVVIVTDTATGCYSSGMVTVNVLSAPVVYAGRDTSVSLGSSVGLNAMGAGVVSWSWYPNTGLNSASIPNPVATPAMTTAFQVVGTDVNGCTDMDSVTVTVIVDYNLTVSNIMTPNGDGYNDHWVIQNLDNYPGTKVVVVNREGQEVFSSDAYDNNWDGTGKGGKKLTDGTYYYVVQIPGSDKLYKGAITILSEKSH